MRKIVKVEDPDIGDFYKTVISTEPFFKATRDLKQQIERFLTLSSE